MVERAGDLLWANGLRFTGEGRNAIVQRWLKRFTVDQIAGCPPLALAAAGSDLARGQLDLVQHWTAAARMGEDAASGYRLEGDDSPWRSVCCFFRGVAAHLTAARAEARGHLEEGVRRAVVAAPNVQTLCFAQLAMLAADEHDWESGAVVVARATAQVERYGLADYPTSALVFAWSALVHTRRGRVDEAKQDIRGSTALLGALTEFIPWYEVETRVALARALLHLGDVPGARDSSARQHGSLGGHLTPWCSSGGSRTCWHRPRRRWPVPGPMA